MVGNIKNYNKIDTLRCFLLIRAKISREELTKRLEVGEGSIRAILNILKDKKLIKSTKKGHFLSNKGEGLLKNINNLIEIKKNINIDFYKNSKNTALLLKNNKDLKFNIFQRDIAIKNGADSCLIFKYKNNKLFLPLFKLKFNFGNIEKNFDLKDNNLVIITSSNNERVAENSALAVSIEINKDFNKIVNEII